jgi:hypothetical protein
MARSVMALQKEPVAGDACLIANMVPIPLASYLSTLFFDLF